MEEALIREIIARVVAQMAPSGGKAVPVEVSARHIHLSQKDVETLFGPGHQLTPKRELSQPGQFLAEERVSIVTCKGEFRNVAVLGPARERTQVELSLTDAKTLGVDAPVRQSGRLDGAATVYILANGICLEAKEAAIVAQNHIHMAPADAAAYGVADGQRVRVRMETGRPIAFEDVVVRVSETFSLAMHIDFDEANACAFQKGNSGMLLTGGTERPAQPHIVTSLPVPPPDAPAQQVRVEQKLVAARDAQELAKKAKRVCLAQGVLMTPMAKDVFRDAKVELVYEGGAE